MQAVWIVLGTAVLVLTLLDAFLAVLNYDEAGLFVNRIVRGEWVLIRAFTRRVSRRWRPLVLRQVTGILTVTTLLCWTVGLILGFSLIYLGLIELGFFTLSRGVAPDFVGAFYLSVGQFSTAGADNIAPAGGWINVIPVAEALLSVVMISFFVTFLSNIYSVIQNLRSLCADFFRVGPGVGSPVEALRPFFPAGAPRGLDLHLTFMVNDFNLYCDSLRQDRAAYHFQSGEDQFSLPYALYMTSGELGALQWGLPKGHAATQSPEIIRLIEAFNEFRDRRYLLMRWRAPLALSPLSADEFERQWDVYRAHRLDAQSDPWAARFFALNEAMGDLASTSIPAEPDDPYGRYTGWLAFAHPAQQFVTRVGRDLDFQPIYHDDPVLAADDASDLDARPAPGARGRGGMATWLRRRQIFLDPGMTRTRGALKSLVVVAIAAGIAAATAAAFSFSPTKAGALAGLVAMYASAFPARSRTLMRRAGLIGLVPVAAGVACGTVLPREHVWTVLGLALAAALAVWAGRFGPVAASGGRLFFIASFFAAVLAVEPSHYLAALSAAGLGVIVSWGASFVPPRPPLTQLRGVSRALRARASMLLETAVGFLSTGTDRSLLRRLGAEAVAIKDTGSRLATVLDPDDPSAGIGDDTASDLRLRVFDVELAAEALRRAVPETADYAISVATRSVLSGELVAVQRYLATLGGTAPVAPYVVAVSPQAGWTDGARRLLTAIGDLAEAFGRLDVALRSASVPDAAASKQDASALSGTRPMLVDDAIAQHPVADASMRTSAERGALQAALSVGLSLLVGGLVSVGAEYWAALPAYQSLTSADGLTWARNLQRIVAAVAGAAGAFALALWTDHDPIVAFVVLLITVFFAAFLRRVASAWTVFWQMVLLATMYDTVSAIDPETVGVRIVETLAGAVIALAVSGLVLPSRTRSKLMRRMSVLVGSAMAVTHAAFGRLAHPGDADGVELADLDAEASRQLRVIQMLVRPARDGAGSSERGGIDAQLMSLWALLHYVRLLATADVPDPAAVATPAQWRRLDAATHDNFIAALAALDGRMPARVHEADDAVFAVGGATASGTGAEPSPMHDIRRINEALLAYADDVAPGSTTSRTMLG